ncbi:hypothetical protein VTK26DRAFT_7948 [Humicola hyalothermophila]
MADSNPPDAAAAPAAETTTTDSATVPTQTTTVPAQTTTEPAQTSDTGILPASHWAPIEEVLDDGDSGYSDLQSSTASLSSSILQYRTIHGRTYHGDVGKAESWEPNDAQHVFSMDVHHHMCLLMEDGKLCLTPIKDDIKKVVDIGTGTGIWAIDFGDQYPNAEVIGTDVSPIQPAWVPPNVKFEIDDANLDWTWPDNTFDFVHVRFLIGCIEDWRKFYREAYRCCKPGGWIEHQEPSLLWFAQGEDVPEDSPMGQWGKVFQEGGRKFGRTFTLVDEGGQQKYMEEAGFTDITVKEFQVPSGDWPKDPHQKEIGTFARLALDSDIEGYILYMWSAIMGWSHAEIQVYIAHLRRQIRTPGLRPWFLRRVVYARKPENAE